MPNNVLHTQRKAPLLIGMELLIKNLVLHEDEPQYETEGDATFCRRRFVGGVKRSFQNAETKWVLDSGSSYHITGNKCWLKRISEIDGDKQLQFSVASGTTFCPTHEGDIRTNEIKLSGVYFTEGCSMNIISAGMLESQGLQIDFGDGSFTVRNPESSALVGEGYLDTQEMRYVVNYLNFKKKYISEAGSAEEIAEASTIIAPEASTQRNVKKRKREATESWIVDSGNAHHLTSTLDDMMKLHSVDKSNISLGTPFGQKIEIRREGNKRSSTIRLNRVWYSLDISHNLISVPQLDIEGYKVRLLSGVCTVW
ncbi:uncharacterized protein [Miscanthus floridulus]|uniref:uncharacterized protein n=1 Tax=Miscanthus floridulus TaxID=154761 RepID=UPI003458FB77